MPGLEEPFRQFLLPIHDRVPVGFEQVPVSAAAAKFLPLTDQRFEDAANRVFGDCLIVGIVRCHKCRRVVSSSIRPLVRNVAKPKGGLATDRL